MQASYVFCFGCFLSQLQLLCLREKGTGEVDINTLAFSQSVNWLPHGWQIFPFHNQACSLKLFLAQTGRNVFANSFLSKLNVHSPKKWFVIRDNNNSEYV